MFVCFSCVCVCVVILSRIPKWTIECRRERWSNVLFLFQSVDWLMIILIWGFFFKTKYWLKCDAIIANLLHSHWIWNYMRTQQNHTKWWWWNFCFFFYCCCCCRRSLFSFLGQMSNFVSYMNPHDAGKNTLQYTHANANFDNYSFFFSRLSVRSFVRSRISLVYCVMESLSLSFVWLKLVCERCVCCV